MTTETNPDPTAFARPPRGEGRWAFGVCAGLARRWGVDAGLLRVVAFFGVLTGVGLLAYLALALVMPVLGSNRDESWRRGLAQALLGALRLGAWSVLAIGAGLASALVAAFGLSWLVLLGCLAIVGGVIALRADVLLPAAVVAVAMALPAAGFALSDHHVARSTSTLVVNPQTPADGLGRPGVSSLHTGTGEILLDLRDFKAPQGSTTSFSARSDLSRVVVALPTSRCFNLRVKYRRLDGNLESYAGQALTALTGWRGTELSGSAGGGSTSMSQGISEAEQMSDHIPSAPTLLAFGRVVDPTDGIFVRATNDPDAPTLDLDLTSSAEAVVRDLPKNVGPLADGGTLWPGITAAPDPPDPSQVSEPRKRERLAERRARWVGRTARFAQRQAEQFAGACATDAQKRDRWVLDDATLPYSSPIKDAYPTEVNGLGERRLLSPELATVYSEGDVSADDLAQQKRKLEAYAAKHDGAFPNGVR